MMKVVALTGGIASGKSEVLNIFMRLGAFVIDCDVLSREALQPCSEAWWNVVRKFGRGILRADLEIDRAKLREIVFSDDEKRISLERIVHPVVRQKLRERLEAIKTLTSENAMAEESEDDDVIVVVDVPLLFELGMQHDFDSVIVIYASEEKRLRRLMNRDKIGAELARNMLKAQMPLEEKVKLADHVIYNEGSIDETEKQVRKIFQMLTAQHDI